MADSDYNAIKPVENLQNIAGLNPVKDREQRKRRQNLHTAHKDKRKSAEGEMNESVASENRNSEPADDKNDAHSIDYCA